MTPSDSSAVDPPWFVRAVAISLASTTLSVSRFGYSVLLPGMRAGLHWSYTQAGGMNTANGLGYLGGALVAALVIALLGERRTFTLSFALTALSLVASGFTTSYIVLLCLRVLAGLAGAVLFIAGSTLIARLAGDSSSPGLILGIYFAGVGPGILVSALLVPLVLGTAEGWRIGWIVMGVVALVSLLPAHRAIQAIPATLAPARHEPAHLGRLVWAIAAFVLFGAGYISYMTFILAYYHQIGRTHAQITIFWSLLAVASIASAWTWKSLLDRSRGGMALAILLGTVTIGAALPLLSDGMVSMVVSSVLFGGAFLSVIAAMTQLIRRSLPPHRWAFGLAVSTSLFAVGQASGPVLTGLLADRSGSLRTGLVISTILLAVAAGIAARQRVVGMEYPSSPSAVPVA